MFSDVLLTVDYDRTLTGPDSTIPQRNIEAIKYFIANGGTFTVNTGRCVPACASWKEKVPMNAPILAYNGSAWYDPKTGAILQKVELPVLNVTSCCFGGEDMQTLFITSAAIGKDEKRFKTATERMEECPHLVTAVNNEILVLARNKKFQKAMKFEG